MDLFLRAHVVPVGLKSQQLYNGYDESSRTTMAMVPADTVPMASALNPRLMPEETSTSGRDLDLTQAHAMYKSGDYEGALKRCQQVYENNVNRPDVLLLLGAIHYQLRNFDKCLALNSTAIQLNPTFAEAHSNMANALQQMGNLDMAIVYYQNAIALRPTFCDAYNNLASVLVQKGLVPQAVEWYYTALRINPDLWDVHSNLGDICRAQGNAAGAYHCYAQAIRCSQGFPQAWVSLAGLYRDTGDVAQAVACYKEAIRLQPDMDNAITNLGTVYKDLRQFVEAEECFRSAIALRPACAVAMGNLAALQYESGRLQEAIHTYREAILLDSTLPELYNNLGNALRGAGQIDEAIRCYTACLSLQTLYRAQNAKRFVVAYNNLAGVLKLQGRVAEACASYEYVVQLQPGSAEAHAHLASMYKDANRHEEAIVGYQRALALRPDFMEAFSNLVHSLQCVCDWTNREGLLLQLEVNIRRQMALGQLPSVQPFHMMAYPMSSELAKEVSMRYAEHCALTASRLGVGPFTHPERRRLAVGERLKIAYVSSDFANHPLSHLMASVFALHDASLVEVFCYALSSPDGSPWRSRIESQVGAEHFADVSALSIEAIAAKISADGIHIAVNLNGYTKGARNEIFALRPAPIQVSYMGFPATTGADYIHYLITDKVVSPPELAQCYSEKLAYMPHCYFVNDYLQSQLHVLDETIVPSRASQGLPEDKIIFSCSNQLYKYDPETYATWMRVLLRVPNSVLWLLRFPPYGEVRLRQTALAMGISSERIIFTDVASKELHIARSGIADVFLDTPCCNAHTTGCDVLWSGCPIITLPLERMASRVAASLCYAIGCGEKWPASPIVPKPGHAPWTPRVLGGDACGRAAGAVGRGTRRLDTALWDLA
mmetsp:Transcript_24123/g.75676  ORF Transcript_24123/g.75676 Transcript_24123/m.75676 type:complete len:888 (-) Transcript_24123:416-3079(-)